MGASAAYHLTRLGIRDVVLVEREALLGAGSTGRNAGGVRHQFSTRVNIALSIESIRFLERFETELGHPIDFHQHGYLFLLSSSASMAAFERNVALQRSMGVEVSWLEPSDAARLAPGLNVDGIVAATFCGRDGIADPHGVTMGFARAAQARGAQIRRACEVTAIGRAAGRVSGVETTQGAIDAPVVVNAAGPWAGRVAALAGVDLPIQPVRRHIFIAQAPPSGRWIVPQTRIMVIDFDTTFYFHREGAGVLFGMADPREAPGFDVTVRWDFLNEVTRVAVARLPALADASIAHAWAGLYEMTPDAMPIIGPSPELSGFFTIAGFSGHGFQHSPAAGRILADLIAGRDPGLDVAPFSAGRFRAGTMQPETSVV